MSSRDTVRSRQELDRRTLLRSVGAIGALGVGVGGVRALGSQEGLSAPATRGSLEQLVVTGARSDATLTLYGPDGEQRREATADDAGAYVFDDLDPASGYQVTQTVDGEESPRSEPVTVFGPDYTPPQEFYDEQTLSEGFGYFEVRDGTTLAHQVVLPDAAEFGEPPYPVVIDYSGYEPSTNFYDDFEEVFTSRGYAVVGVNKRGTACSGGKFDFGERLQWYDGYDMVEVIAAQDWASNVGLAGKSYPGYMQLYVAATQPPSLSAIAPGHVVGEFYRDVAYPGGMFNLTFAGDWAVSRDEESAPGGEQGNVDSRIASGDELCERNQRLRRQNPGLYDQMAANRFYTEFYRERNPWNLVDRIDVPTILVAAWQDEQTGSRPVRLLERFSEDIPVRLVAANGDHDEYYGPAVFDRIERFFAYYLKEETPESEAEGHDSFEDALAAYESEDPIEVLWELDGDRSPRGSSQYANWPPESVDSWRLYCQPDGSLLPTPPEAEEGAAESTAYEYSPRGVLDQIIPELNWSHQPEGTAASFVSGELAADRMLLGSASVELWVASSADDTDIEVTLSEIRPDGSEMYVQNGWLRASHRVEDESRSKPRRPWHTHQPDDQQSLPDEEFTRLRVEVFPFGHVFREGSRVKLAVETPGGNRPLWGYENVETEATNEVAHTPAMASSVALPLVATADAPAESYPDCGNVRSQPCRPVDETELVEVDADSMVPDDGDAGDGDDDGSGNGDNGDGDTGGDGDDGSGDDGAGDGGMDDGAGDGGMDDGAGDGEQQSEDDDDGSDGAADDGGVGFGVPAALSGLGGASYLLKRRLGDSGDGTNSGAPNGGHGEDE